MKVYILHSKQKHFAKFYIKSYDCSVRTVKQTCKFAKYLLERYTVRLNMNPHTSTPGSHEYITYEYISDTIFV
jgi:hypothetical protein